jgi:hypothetical protein
MERVFLPTIELICQLEGFIYVFALAPRNWAIRDLIWNEALVLCSVERARPKWHQRVEERLEKSD